MADSADDLLRQAREALHDWITAYELTVAESIASGRLASAFEMLDALMSAGGPLPADWVPAADRTVTVVHLTDQISVKVTADDRMPPGTAAMIGDGGQVIVMAGLGEGGPLTVKRLLSEPGLIQEIADPAIRETLGIRERPGGTDG